VRIGGGSAEGHGQMVKMIPHQIIPKSFAKHPVIELLSKHKLFDFDEPSNIVEIACELHYVVPKRFADDPVIALLRKHNLFDFEAEKNTIYLPIDRLVAKKLGVSPYSSEPLESYINGIGDVLKRFGNSPTFASAQRGDMDALRQLEQTVSTFQAKIVEGLKTGKLFLTPPLA
jgi:hypothetical protein